jgi:hypothetical protein
MPRYIDLSRGRALRPAALAYGTAQSPAVAAAERELLAGDYHRVLPLIGQGALDLAGIEALVANNSSRLQIASSFFVFINRTPGHEHGIGVDRGVFETDTADPVELVRRYTAEVTPLAHRGHDINAKDLRGLEGEGQTLVTAVATIADQGSGERFDALYVPRLWDSRPGQPGAVTEATSVAHAAGYMVRALTLPPDRYR